MAIEKLRENFERQKKIAEEIRELSEELRDSRNAEEGGIIASQIESLKKYLRKYGEGVVEAAEGISVPKPLDISKTVSGYKMQPVIQPMKGISPEKAERFDEKISALERLTLGRMKKKEVKVIKRKEKKPSLYVKLASSLFYDTAMSLIKKGKFYMLRRDLIRANLEFVPATYISLIFFTVPAGVYLFAYFYPSMEKKTLENRINRELPFATIHMSSISNSMIEPSKIFSIIISTEEYPNLEKEFTKLFNEVNVYGYDLVTALRDMAFNSPSRKLAELYNGLATTITSGGDLPNFFDKRAQTLLFEHRLETEKHSKAAETFMDIYISVVIAAPMILMLLLMMMRLSGLGISLSTGMITLVMVLGVSLMNVLFLSFLHLKQPEGA